MALNFRPLAKADFPQFAAWLAKPHVQKWWPEPATAEHVAREYGGCTDGDFRTRVYVVQEGATPIGIIQSFELKSYPDWAARLKALPGAVGIDYLIGEESYVGRGVGTKMIKRFVETVVREVYSNASCVMTSAELDNPASLGALAKAGFAPGAIITGEHGSPERVMQRQFGDQYAAYQRRVKRIIPFLL